MSSENMLDSDTTTLDDRKTKLEKPMAVVWQFAVIHFENKTLLTGVVLKNAPFTYPKPISKYKHLVKLAKSYATSAFRKKEITIKTDGEEIVTTTDKKGGFRIVVDFIVSGNISVTTGDDHPLPLIQSYPVLFENPSCNFDVISDIDDTIMISNTANALKRVGTIALKVPHRRKVIGFTQTLFEEFSKCDARVFYVSKSESNLFSIIATFIRHNNLPTGPLLLTPFLKSYQLLNPKKGKDYKANHIRFLFENSGDKKFILLGDDSQRDMEIYTGIAKEFSERIIKIYIRQTRSHRSARQQTEWKALEATGVPVRYFNNEDSADEELSLYR